MKTRKVELQKTKEKIFMFLSVLIFVSLLLVQFAHWLDSSILPKIQTEEKSAKKTSLNSTILIQVQTIKQKPELYNGCEVT